MNIAASAPPRQLALHGQDKFYAAAKKVDQVLSGEEMVDPVATIRAAIVDAREGVDFLRRADAAPGDLRNQFTNIPERGLEGVAELEKATMASGTRFEELAQTGRDIFWQVADDWIPEVLHNTL